MSEIKFEDKMNKLKTIVEQLDNEDTDLDTSIKLYEEGLKLSKELKLQLKSFEEKIDNIDKENNNE
ncbi:MAG: exodeoxyribonuclease VII small subunit [Erysipelotrichaceae bacterium]|nr:exodeoxyribonuclease VII small subunit [Erysipelotrichaceae bacterium]